MPKSLYLLLSILRQALLDLELLLQLSLRLSSCPCALHVLPQAFCLQSLHSERGAVNMSKVLTADRCRHLYILKDHTCPMRSTHC